MYDTTYGHKTLRPGRSVANDFLRDLAKATPLYLFATAIRAALRDRKG